MPFRDEQAVEFLDNHEVAARLNPQPTPGAHLNAVGAFQPETREVDEETVRRSRVVVDTYNGAFSEAGDILLPLRSRAIKKSHILVDLHEALTGNVSIRKRPSDITLFKSVGCALEDLAAAQLLIAPRLVPAS
jgi:ornithine cyclodeaminase